MPISALIKKKLNGKNGDYYNSFPREFGRDQVLALLLPRNQSSLAGHGDAMLHDEAVSYPISVVDLKMSPWTTLSSWLCRKDLGSRRKVLHRWPDS